MLLTNDKFLQLMKFNKIFLSKKIYLPTHGKNAKYDLKSTESSDSFIMDISRSGKIEISKFKIQERYTITKLPLVRIDINSTPHTNPDGTRLSRNHIHIYKYTENDNGNLPWAYELSDVNDFGIVDINNLNFMTVFYGFCKYCNIDVSNNDIQGVI